MAKTVVNPTAELPPRAGDVDFTLDELARLSIFTSIKKAPSFAKFPGSYVLRRYRPGEVICHQGQPGQSAFYMLTRDDLAAVCEHGDASAKLDERLAPLKKVTQQQTSLAPGAAERLATARLLASGPASKPSSRGFWSRLIASPAPSAPAEPQLIPNDGPTDIDYESREAAIFAGEVFGEMSCLTRQPRSATVVADKECFALEILRNVLDQMRKDPQYKQQSEQKYRERVMEGHLRQLSLFGLLSADEFRKIASQVELVEAPSGAVLWDEGDAPDSIYVVRSGIVQVIQSVPWQTMAADVTDWPKLCAALRAAQTDDLPQHAVWSALSSDVQQALKASGDEVSEGLKSSLLAELNRLAKGRDLLENKLMKSTLDDPRIARETASFSPKSKDWTELEVRRANRILLHVLFGDALRAPEPPGVARVLSYLGRGDTLGEIGLALGQPRTATCMAYAHPGTAVETLNVELVKISAALFRELVEISPVVRDEIKKLVATRRQRDVQRAAAPIESLAFSGRAERLGLLQGQKLMLIDLDRCTRCGDCVEACIATHDDGYSRLFLDGPRFGNYLIPSSCRKCRDPVCMIGCPVGSIQQGEAGEILIRDWCIGCGVCARQCPYDSIQMHDASIVPAHAAGWHWSCEPHVASENWFAPGYIDRNWHHMASPILYSIDVALHVHAAGHNPAAPQFYFRLPFAVAEQVLFEQANCRFVLTTQGAGAKVYLNGKLLELTQDARQQKRGEYEARVSTSTLRTTGNVLAVTVAGPVALGEVLLEAELDLMAAEQEEVEEKLVTEQAVVCDQCSSLAGNRHACVYACPHEAAMRVDAWVDFPER